MSISRREFLIGVCFVRGAFGASDFWNKKPPAEWSELEVSLLLAQSPWAKIVSGEMRVAPVKDSNMPAGFGMPGGGLQSIEVKVRWESAQPVLDALKATLPDGFEDRYVVGVMGVGAVKPGEKDVLMERLKDSVFLTARGKNPIQPNVMRRAKDGAEVLFGFAKDAMPLTASDKDVVFTINTGELAVKAKFEPKEMVYHGRLAV